MKRLSKIALALLRFFAWSCVIWGAIGWWSGMPVWAVVATAGIITVYQERKRR